MLKFFIGVINAKLFKAVDIKCFKPSGKKNKKNIKMKTRLITYHKYNTTKLGGKLPINVEHTNKGVRFHCRS